MKWSLGNSTDLNIFVSFPFGRSRRTDFFFLLETFAIVSYWGFIQPLPTLTFSGYNVKYKAPWMVFSKDTNTPHLKRYIDTIGHTSKSRTVELNRVLSSLYVYSRGDNIARYCNVQSLSPPQHWENSFLVRVGKIHVKPADTEPPSVGTDMTSDGRAELSLSTIVHLCPWKTTMHDDRGRIRFGLESRVRKPTALLVLVFTCFFVVIIAFTASKRVSYCHGPAWMPHFWIIMHLQQPNHTSRSRSMPLEGRVEVEHRTPVVTASTGVSHRRWDHSLSAKLVSFAARLSATASLQTTRETRWSWKNCRVLSGALFSEW